MGLQPALILGNGVEDAGDAVGNVVADEIADVEDRDDDADGGVDEVEVVALGDVGVGGEETGYYGNEELEE